MLLVGTVLKTEHIQGQNDTRSWDFWQVTVWDGDEAHACMVGRDLDARQIGQGEDVAFAVQVQPRKNNRSGAYELSVTLLRRVDLAELVTAPSAARAA